MIWRQMPVAKILWCCRAVLPAGLGLETWDCVFWSALFWSALFLRLAVLKKESGSRTASGSQQAGRSFREAE